MITTERPIIGASRTEAAGRRFSLARYAVLASVMGAQRKYGAGKSQCGSPFSRGCQIPDRYQSDLMPLRDADVCDVDGGRGGA